MKTRLTKLVYRFLFLSFAIPFISYGQTQVGQINVSGALLYNPRSIATWSNYAIVASQGSNALEIIDISNPAAPSHVCSVRSGPNTDQFLGVNSIAVSGNLAFAVSTTYMTIVDITNPTAPTIKSSTKINTYGSCQNCTQIYVAGNYAYVVDNAAIIFDISNASAPIQLGKISSQGQPWEVAMVAGNYLYLGNYDTFEIVDVSNPLHPVVTGSLADGTGGASFQFISSIAVSGNHAFVASSNNNAIEVIDISNPQAPTYAGSIVKGQGGALLYDPSWITIVGDKAYVTSRFSGSLEILDISTPTAPVYLSSITNGQGGVGLTSPLFVTVTNNIAYVACNRSIEVFDVTTAASPTSKGEIVDGASGNGAKLDAASALVVSGNYAYIQSNEFYSNFLEIVDISNPASPTHAASLPGGGGRSLFLSGNFLYRAWNYGMDIVDVSNPLSPVSKGIIFDGTGGAKLSEVSAIFVQGNYAYVVSENNPATFEIINVSNPSSPTHVSSLVINPGSGLYSVPNAVVVSGNYAYVADFGASLIEVIDIHNPAAPVQVTTISDGQGGALLQNAYSIALKGNYLYVTSTSSGALEIIDISNPTSPSHVSNIKYGQGGDVNSFPEAIAVSGNYAFLLTDSNLEVVDITDPHHLLHAGSSPEFWGAYIIEGNNAVAVQGDYVYFTGNNGLHVISIFSPTPVVASAASSISSSSFTANWNAVTGATSYQVDVSTDNFDTRVAGYNGASASGTSLSVTGLSANTNYQYRVRSVNSAGSSLNSNIISATTLLQAPTATTATNVTQTNFIANWNAVAGATSYHLDIAADQLFNTILISTTTPTTSLAVYNRHDSTTYWIRVSAQNAISTSANSNVISVTTLALKQQTITLSLSNVALGDSPLTLKGKASSGLPIKYSINDTTIAVVKDSTLSIKKVGPCIITASQSGDSIYRAASARQTICVNPPQPVVTQSGSDPNIVLTSSATIGNQWFLNGLIILSGTDQTIPVTESGSYTTQVTLNGCSSKLSVPMAMTITGDIALNNSQRELNFYPNPAINAVFIDLSNLPTGEPVSIEVVDVLGRNLDRQLKSGGTVEELNVSGYPAGIYLINISKQSQVLRGRFVKE